MSPRSYAIRSARTDDLTALQAIEDLAGRQYGAVGIDPDLPGVAMETLSSAQASGLLWVMADSQDEPVGFALAWLRPGALHLRELDVLPTHGRRGLGARLVAHVATEAQRRGFPLVTLTTFTEAPWNAPYYERLGFRRLAAEGLPEWLAAIRHEEASEGLDRWPRIAMALRIPACS